MSITTSVSIVIPMFNEAKRLRSTIEALRRFLLAHPEIEKIVMVDDGSTDGTREILAREAPKELPIEIVWYSKNAGKGYAVRRGVLETSSEMVLISDADLSTPLDEIRTLSQHLDRFDVAIGSRAIDPSMVRKRQPWYRQTMGKTFNVLMRAITGLPFRDTQCGFKLFRGDVAREIFREAVVDRFAFDVEILVLALQRGYSVCEVPVLWFNAEGSRVSIGRDSTLMLLDTIRTRLRLGVPPTGAATAAGDGPTQENQAESEQQS